MSVAKTYAQAKEAVNRRLLAIRTLRKALDLYADASYNDDATEASTFAATYSKILGNAEDILVDRQKLLDMR